MATVGVIGLGEMGLSITTRLRSLDRRIVGYDPDPKRVADAEALGVLMFGSPAEVAAEADGGVLVNVRTAAHLVTATHGAGGLLDAVKGRTLVIMGTFAPETVEKLGAETEAAGGHLVDAPHTGSSPAAESGQLVIWLAGDSAAIRGVQSVMDDLASRTHVIGPRPGLAQVVKLINAVGLAINLGALTEMQMMARLHGINEDEVLRYIDGCSGSTWVSAAMPWVGGFLSAHQVTNLHKDVALLLADATQDGYETPVSSAAMHSLRHTWPRRKD
jgi:3-hydroxyisobutyrate dehydrogenase-like beta-hydroxyacid dehydrogenase